MKNNCIFTICSNNYLAQALTLKESVLRHEPDSDFHIFIADVVTKDVKDLDLKKLNVSWLPDWQSMAFKYNVIEFNTSIKPFCFNALFKEKYQKVAYFDPDTYVTNSLEYIFNSLDEKSIMLTPHYCDIVEEFNGAVPESTFNCAGIFNLGFVAIKNNSIGGEIVTWWMNRLHSSCYSARSEGLFVDQKWMDFIPSFFPNDTCICSHHGMNVAIWNLHERALEISDHGEYNIKRKKNGQIYPLLFFHFSGFDPFDRTAINRRHPEYNILTYPSFKPIIEEYREALYRNGYEIYSHIQYAFNSYNDGTQITPLQRRLYRQLSTETNFGNPFDSDGIYYQLLKKNHLLIKSKTKETSFTSYSTGSRNKAKVLEKKIIQPMLRFFVYIFGVEKFSMLVRLCEMLGVEDYHKYLIKQ